MALTRILRGPNSLASVLVMASTAPFVPGEPTVWSEKQVHDFGEINGVLYIDKAKNVREAANSQSATV